MPEEWIQALDLWRETAAPHLSDVNGAPAPDANDQVILLQALLGAWPLELLEGADGKELTAFQERMEGYLTKALREAKRHTSWVAPNEAYEGAALKLLHGLLDPKNPFLDRFQPLARRLSLLGMLKGLSRTILKMTLPGVPDIYQGTEFWDFSLVDPDNRRPVDYTARIEALDTDEPLAGPMRTWPDGRIKQHILSRLLHDRAASPALYAEGDYRPLSIEGERAADLLGYVRQHGEDILAVIVPRLWRDLTDGDRPSLDQAFWRETAVTLPHGRWRNVLTGEDILIGTERQKIAGLVSTLPFVVLKRDGDGGTAR
jgi:(1->4)-alpha-D-glucan 1-alpha-D-glucosylmutase